MATRTFEILDGPSREELFDAARLIEEYRKVRFRWVNIKHMEGQFLIFGVEIESQASSGLGQKWIIKAVLLGTSFQDGLAHMTYNTQTRKGMITF